jgi:hypothetical protein
MSIPNEAYRVLCKGDGRDDSVYPIPFGFTQLTSIVVRTLPEGGDPVRKVYDTDYTINPTTTGEGEVFVDRFAEGGWVVWIGTSPTDTIEIFREESVTQSYDLSGSLDAVDTDDFEKTLDKMTMGFSQSMKREKSDPTTHGAKNRVVKDVGQPVRWNDALTGDELDVMSDDTTNLTVPVTTLEIADQFLKPSALHPSTPSVEWGKINEQPAKYGTDRNALISSGGGAYDWSGVNWIPPAPNNGAGWFMHTDGLGNLDWEVVYEVPLDQDGEVDDVMTKLPHDILGWRNIPRELDASDLTDTYDYSNRTVYVKETTGGNSTYEMGPRIWHGTKSITVTIPHYDDGTIFHTGSRSPAEAGIDCPTFSIEHGVVDDNGDAAIPDRVFLTIENPAVAIDYVWYYPFWIVRIDDFNEDSEGITSTHINGRAIYLNVNDNLKTASGGASDQFGSIPITKYNLALTDYQFKVHWIAFLD